MDFDFPDELKQLRETARAFLREHCPPRAVRRVIDDGAPFDLALWHGMAEMGWIGAAIPAEYGGAGLGRLAVCVLAEELGRAVAPVPFGSSAYLATEALLLFGSPAQQGRYLPSLASGDAIGAFAWVERPGAVRPDGLDTIARDGRLTGTKAPVADGEAAGFAVVATRADAGAPSLHLVDLNGPGVRRERVTTFDPSRGHARLRFEAAPAEPLAAAVGPDAIRTLLDHAAVPTAFEQVGNAEAALEMARDYALTRYAFGRPIGSFQAVKHKLADVYVAVELARSNAYWAAWAAESGAAELPVAAASARIAACDAGWIATKENIQTHGGMGYTWQFDCHLYYRRAKLLGLALGSGAEWKRRLIAELRQRNVSELEPA